MNRKQIIVALTVVAILAAAVITMVVLVKTKPQSRKAPSKKVVVGVKTTPVQLNNYSLEVTYPGRVTAREIVTLSSEVSGRLIAADVPLKVGQRFRKGDVIVRIFDEDVKAAYTAQVSTFLNTLAHAMPDIKLDLPDEYDKWQKFFSDIELEGALPKLPTINSDKEKVYLAAKNILTSYYNLVQDQIILSRYEIRAPFNGTYTSVAKEVGGVTSTNAEVARITSTDMLELEVGEPLEGAQILSKGTKVDIVSDSGKKYTGSIDRISSFVNPNTQRVNVYILFNEPGLDIIAGQVLSLTIPSKEIVGVQEVMREAVVSDTLVYLVRDNKLLSRRIDVVASTPTKSYISGVELGDTIVNESLVSPHDGMDVKKLNMSGKIIDPAIGSKPASNN